MQVSSRRYASAVLRRYLNCPSPALWGGGGGVGVGLYFHISSTAMTTSSRYNSTLASQPPDVTNPIIQQEEVAGYPSAFASSQQQRGGGHTPAVRYPPVHLHRNLGAALCIPRVLSWYKPNAPFDMERVVRLLEEHHIPIECAFPPQAASSSSSGGGSPTSNPASAPTGSNSDSAGVKQHQRSGGSSGAVGSVGSSSSSSSSRSGHSAKSLEVVGFCTKGIAAKANNNNNSNDSRRLTTTPPRRNEEGHGEEEEIQMVTPGMKTQGVLEAGESRTTYFIFADGSIVGWNSTWEELVWMRGILQPAAAYTPPAAGGGGGVASSSSQQQQQLFKPTTSRQQYIVAKVYDMMDLCGTVCSTLSERRLWRWRRSDTAGTTTEDKQHSRGGGGGGSATTSASSSGSSSPFPPAVDSMRYQLYESLPDTERPQDEPDLHSFIDVDNDRVILEDDLVSTKLPFSYALVQSVKLDALQATLEPVAQEVKRWQQQLSTDGTLLCTLKTLRKVKTQLLALVESLNFRHHTQTTPRIFWSGEFNALRSLYRDACEHLEIEDRAHSLKVQMETIDESLSYLHDEVHANMNEWLTVVIIILIATELSVALGILQALVHVVHWLFLWTLVLVAAGSKWISAATNSSK